MLLFCLSLIFTGIVINTNPAKELNSDDLNLSAMIQPVDTNLFFKDSDYYNWCNSIVKDSSGVYHLFYSRWPKSIGFTSWLTHSVIAHAVSSSAQGPYLFKDIALSPRGAGFWDCYTTHNVRIVEDNKQYYMLYTGSNSGNTTYTQSHIDSIGSIGYRHKDWKTIRSSQRSSMAISNSLNGPWKPLLNPIVQPDGPIGVIAVNPTITKGNDGLYYMMLKGDDIRFQNKEIRLIQALGTAPTIEGPYSILKQSPFDELKTEDAFMWFDKKRNRFYSIFHVHDGDFIGLITSEDGRNWYKAKHYYVCKKELLLTDNTIMKVDNMERPSIYFENDEAKTLSFAIKKGNDAFIIFINLQ